MNIFTLKAEVDAQLPEGFSSRIKAAKRGAMGAVDQVIITGPKGDDDAVTDPAQIGAAIAKIHADYARRTAPKPEPAPAAATGAPRAERPAPRDSYGRTCRDHETDNHGRCYSCGTYVRADDAGRTIRRGY